MVNAIGTRSSSCSSVLLGMHFGVSKEASHRLHMLMQRGLWSSCSRLFSAGQCRNWWGQKWWSVDPGGGWGLSSQQRRQFLASMPTERPCCSKDRSSLILSIVVNSHRSNGIYRAEEGERTPGFSQLSVARKKFGLDTSAT